MQNSVRENVAEETVAARLDAGLQDARLRILIVGAGIAGATLAALMRQRGDHVAVVERNDHTREADRKYAGYMLGLMPLGGRVLNGLGLAPRLAAQSLPMRQYAFHNRNGKLLRTYPMAPILDRFGSLDGIERGDLIAMLRDASRPIVYGATVKDIVQSDDAARVTFDDGSCTSFDLVVVADGMHSQTRALVLKPEEVEPYETGWGGWVVWADTETSTPDTYRELWSAGWGIGLYPVPDRTGIFLAGEHEALKDSDAETCAAQIERRLPKGPIRDALRQREQADAGFYWKMADSRAKVWRRGRVVLLGDAAAAFLPTAGIGASVAMDSAAALADELARADASHMTHALSLYEKRQRPRVELAQENSRALAKVMFVSSPWLTWLRDQAMRFYSLKRLIRDISKVMEGG